MYMVLVTHDPDIQPVAHDAFRALVNLSDSPLLVASLAEPTFLNFLVSYIIVRRSFLLFPFGEISTIAIHDARTLNLR